MDKWFDLLEYFRIFERMASPVWKVYQTKNLTILAKYFQERFSSMPKIHILKSIYAISLSQRHTSMLIWHMININLFNTVYMTLYWIQRHCHVNDHVFVQLGGCM